MTRRIGLAVTVVVLVCLLAVGITAGDKPFEGAPVPTATSIPELAVRDAGESAKAKAEEGKVGKREAKIDKAKGAKIEVKKLELERKVAENAGVLGAMGDSDLNEALGASGLSPEMRQGIGGLIESRGSQYGGGGLGGRGRSQGGGGIAGRLDSNGYGSGGGNFGASTSRPSPRTIYISNDDSMSLASAQHVLFALQNDEPLRPQDIRPHEILNYFTFKTAQPAPGELFDVFASAEKDGDHLHVALAVSGATPPRLPLDLTVLVDISCSMDTQGKMDRTKRALLLLSQQLSRGDRVDFVAFNDQATTVFSNWIVGGYRPGLLNQAINAMTPDGSTNLDAGLREAYRVALAHEGTRGRNRRILLITDAQLNTGDINPETVTDIAKAYDESGIRLTGVGVGSDFNDRVLDQLTEKGKGAYVFLGSDEVVDRLFGPVGFASLTQTIAHDVRFALKLPPSLSMEQFFGEEASTNPEEVQPVHFSAGSRQLMLQDLVLHGGVLDPDDMLELEIRYRDAQTNEEQVRRFKSSVGRMVTTDPHNVRKARALMAWADFLDADANDVHCAPALRNFFERATLVSDDAEIAFVARLSRSRCSEFVTRR